MSAIGRLTNALKGLIRWAVITSVSADDKDFPIHGIDSKDRLGDSISWYGFGHHANPPPQTFCLMLTTEGNPENRAILPGSPRERIKPLAEGEVVFYHPETGSKVHFRADGSVDFDVQKGVDENGDPIGGGLNITVAGDALIDVEGNVTADIEGDLTANAAGDADIDVGGTTDIDSVGDIEITAPNVNITGDMLITGDVDIQGDFETTGDALLGDGGEIDLGGLGGRDVARVGNTISGPTIANGSPKVRAMPTTPV